MRLLTGSIWGAAVVLLALTSTSTLTNLVVLVGLILIPGAALSVGLFPGARHGAAARVAVSLALGLAIAILAGIVLDRTPLGIQWTPLLLAITASLSVAVLAGIGRREGPIRLAPIVTDLTSRQLSLLGLALLLSVGAFGLARVGASATSPSDVTQLWILPDARGSVELGVANLSQATQQYRLVLSLDGRDIKAWPAIRLEPGGVWKGAPDAIIPKGDLRALLYRSDLPGRAVREVSISLPALGR